VEPSGGNWKTILLSVDAVTVPEPPADTATELAEVRDLQSKLTPRQFSSVYYWNVSAVLRWNEIARDLATYSRTPPPKAARVYALLSVAQYDALVAVWRYKYQFNRPPPALQPMVPASPEPAYPSEHAAVAAASAAVLGYLYPDAKERLTAMAEEHAHSRLWAGVNLRSDIEAGDVIGGQVAQMVIEYAKQDRSNSVWAGQVPVGQGIWTGVDPLLPAWGQVKPWLMHNGSQFRPPPPPLVGSPEFETALKEVRDLSDHRTEEQLYIAKFWADGPGTSTPPGHWNSIAANLIEKYGLNELRAARALALMNMAVMDAGISCWDTKYAYWYIRPSQADPQITTPVGLPNFPSYTSGHSTFSGAAAEVLAYIFPDEAKSLQAMAEEASISRLYGGIHYRFDSEIGVEVGRQIAALAVERGKADGSP
jgi:membrane-associated phospholipid phosphatase